MRKLSCILIAVMLSTGASACVEFPVTVGRFNMPLVQTSLFNNTIDFILDFSLSHGLSLESSLYEKIEPKGSVVKAVDMDLTGSYHNTETKVAGHLTLGRYPFKEIGVRQANSQGIVLAASTAVEMPANSIGRGLFKDEGVLHYGRHAGVVKWCTKPTVSYPENITWQPLRIDDEGVHVILHEAGDFFDLVVATASTRSVLKTSKANRVSQCPDHHQYNCYLASYGDQGEAFYLLDLPADFKADGMLGDSFFQKYDLYIDHHGKRLGLAQIQKKELI